MIFDPFILIFVHVALIVQINQEIYIYIYIYIYINIYITQKGGYNKYVNEKVTKTYKLAATNRAKYINYKLKILEENVVADDRIEKMEEAEVYITVKDHK